MSTMTTPSRPQVQLDKRQWGRAVGLLQMVLATLVALYVVQGIGRPGGSEDVTATAPQEPLAVTTDTGAEPVAAPAAPAVAEAPVQPPPVRDVIRADFTKGAAWPVGAAARDTAAVSWPMGIVHGAFVHGPAEGPGAVSWLSRAVPGDVRAVGARVRFASKDPGTVALTAWHTSVLAGADDRVPRTGMRLVAGPGRWRLEAIDRQGTATLATGRYRHAAGSESFGLVRDGQEVWVTDPAGRVTQVSDPRVAALAGPWASWELRDNPGTRSVAIEEIWAG